MAVKQKAARGKISRFCRTLLLAASVAVLSGGVSEAQQTGVLADLNQRILENPQDVELNLQYARAAEAANIPRLALAAYERILINDPTNVEARRGYERLRRAIEPPFTVARVEAGVRWDTNVTNTNPDWFFFGTDDTEASTAYAKLMVADERPIFGRRWRSILNVHLQETSEFDQLDYQFLGVQTGPLFYVAPHTALIPAVGAAASWLGGESYFTEINLGLTLEGRSSGGSYWARLRAGAREYEDHGPFVTTTEDGIYVELDAGLTKPRVFAPRDTLVVSPFVRWSDIEGAAFDFSTLEDVSPGRYLEYGADVAYNYQINDHLQASIGALVRQRDFTDSSREDTYISPQAGLTVQGVLPCACDVRLQYRYRDNDSTSEAFTYDANQVSLGLVARF